MDSDFEETIMCGEGSGDSGEFIVNVEHGMGLDYPIRSIRGLNGSGYPESHTENDLDPLSFATDHSSDDVKCLIRLHGSERSTERLADDSKATQSLPLFTSPNMQEKNVRYDKIQRFSGGREPGLDDLSGICIVDYGDLAGLCKVEYTEPEPPPKRRSVVKPRDTMFTKVPELKYSSTEVYKLIASNSRVTRFQDVQVFFSKIHEWAQHQIMNNNKLSFCHLLLQTAKIAREIGRPGLRLNENWFTKIKEQWQDFIQPVAYHRRSMKHEASLESVPYKINTKLADWYDHTSSMRSVSPGELERKAVQISTNVGQTFRLSKVWVKNFISEFGLYCTINGEHRLYLKPSDGLLKSHFEAAFEHWYYQVDGNLNRAKLTTSNNIPVLMEWITEASVNNYLSAVLENHVEANDWRINHGLWKTEEEIAAELCGDSEVLDKLHDWQKKWCRSRESSVLRLQRLDAILRKWYDERWTTNLKERGQNWYGAMSFAELENEALLVAHGLGIHEFTATKDWLKRFLELNGLRYLINGHPTVFSRIALSRMSEEEFIGLTDNITTEAVPTTPTKAIFRTTFRSGKSSVNEARTNPVASEAQYGGSAKRRISSVPKVLNGHIKPMITAAPKSESDNSTKAVILTKASFGPAIRSGASSFNKAHTTPAASEAQYGGSVKCRITSASKVSNGQEKPIITTAPKVLRGHRIPQQPLGTQKTLTESVCPVQETIIASNRQVNLSIIGKAISDWYIMESSKGELSPSDVEQKAYEVSQLIKVNYFVPTKKWLASFVAMYGLHFLVDGERVRISKPKAGVLKYQFEAAFEAWYIGMSEPVVKAELDRYFSDSGIVSDGVKNVVRKFHSAAFSCYRKESSLRLVTLPEPQIAKKVSTPGFKVDEHDLLSWYLAQATKVRTFDNAVMASHGGSKILLQPCQLKRMAENIAIQELGMESFQASKQWMKRFVQRYSRLTPCRTFHFEPTSANADSFHSVFEAWYDQDTKDWGSIMEHKFMGLRKEISA